MNTQHIRFLFLIGITSLMTLAHVQILIASTHGPLVTHTRASRHNFSCESIRGAQKTLYASQKPMVQKCTSDAQTNALHTFFEDNQQEIPSDRVMLRSFCYIYSVLTSVLTSVFLPTQGILKIIHMMLLRQNIKQIHIFCFWIDNATLPLPALSHTASEQFDSMQRTSVLTTKPGGGKL